MKASLGVTQVSLREALRGSLLIILPAYAGFLIAVLHLYPSIDEEARLRQALSFGHGALQVGVGLVCLLWGISSIAGDRDRGRTERCTATPIGREGYLLGKMMALGVMALALALSLGGIETLLLRASFRDRPEILGCHPILHPSSFGIAPEEGGEGILWLQSDRIASVFHDPRAEGLRVYARVPPSQADAVRLRIQVLEKGLAEDLPVQGVEAPFTVDLPEWARWVPEGDLWVEIAHVSDAPVRIQGDPEDSFRLVRADGSEILPTAHWRPGLTLVSDGDVRFRPRRARWVYPPRKAGRAAAVTLAPIVYSAGGRGAPVHVTLQRGESVEDHDLLLIDGREVSIPISTSLRSSTGGLEIRIATLDPKVAVGFDQQVGADGAPRSGLFVSGEARGMEWNLFLGALGAALMGVLLGAAGMTASILLSAPVALLAGLALYILGLGAGLFQEVGEVTGENDPVAAVFGIEKSPSPGLIRLASAASRGIPDLNRFDLTAPIVASHVIPPGRVLGLCLYGLLVAAAFLIGGGLVFRRRDLP